MIGERAYYRIMLGAKSAYATECHDGAWFGGGWGIKEDLTGQLPENWRDFNAKFIPVYLEANPGKSKVAAGLACAMLHSICKGIKQGDIVLCPDGQGSYWVGKVVSDYYYVAGEDLPHRRKVEWFTTSIPRADTFSMSWQSRASLSVAALSLLRMTCA